MSKMNVVELLMSEHASLRVYFRYFKELDTSFFFELDGFINNCHARIEDEVVFPRLRAAKEGDSVSSDIGRLEDEHRLLKMLSDNMRVFVAEEKKELSRDKIVLYADTVESHNTSEELGVFKRWKTADKDEETKTAEETLKIIKSFGLDRYLRITGFSQEYLSLVR